MKKSLFAAAIAIFSMTSCSDRVDEQLVADGSEVNVRVSATLPRAIASRTVSDGITAENLRYVVYEVGTTKPIINNSDSTFGLALEKTVDFKLLVGRSYEIIFWADAPNSPYTYNEETKTISVKYTSALANDETRDAFFGKFETGKVTGPIATSVTLKRPFAQINVGTDDWAEAKALTPGDGNTDPVYASEMTVESYSEFNLSTEAVVGQAVPVTFASNPILDQTKESLEVTVDGKKKVYNYIGMNYILMAKDQENVNVVFKYTRNEGDKNDFELVVSNVPAQRNYRTNIIGSLLTNPASIKVVKSPEYEENGDYNREVTVVATAAEMVEALADGGAIVVDQDIVINETVTFSTEVPTTIDLNGNNLTFEKPQAVEDGAEVYINGKSDITARAAANTAVLSLNNYLGLEVKEGGSLIIENVDITNQNSDVPTANVAGYLLSVNGKNAKLSVKNSNISLYNEKCYSITTNASETYTGMEVELENVVIIPKFLSPGHFMINQPVKVTAKNCYFEGCNNAIIARGGDYTFDNCQFVMTLAYDTVAGTSDVCTTTQQDIVKNNFRTLRRDKWYSGTFVPLAAMVIGNDPNSTAYKYPTNIDMTGCKITVPAVAYAGQLDGKDTNIPAIYASANAGEGMGVTINFDDATTIVGDQEYVTTNITVNGEAITENTWIKYVAK